VKPFGNICIYNDDVYTLTTINDVNMLSLIPHDITFTIHHTDL